MMAEERVLITSVHLAYEDAHLAKQLWDIHCINGRVLDIVPSIASDKQLLTTAGRCTVIQGNGGTLLPSYAYFQRAMMIRLFTLP